MHRCVDVLQRRRRHHGKHLHVGVDQEAGDREARPVAAGQRRDEHPDARRRSLRQLHPRPARGLPQYVTAGGALVEGNLASPVPVPANVVHFDTPFLTDIAHNADPSCTSQGGPPVCPTPDPDLTASADFAHQPAGTYDDELLNDHFTCGDGRCNENIALSAIHQVFHHEHDRLVDDIKATLTNDTTPWWRSGAAGLEAGRPSRVARRVERFAPVPGRPLRDRDGVPAPRVRGVRPQGPADGASLPHLQPRHQRGDPRRVRRRGLPLRPLDARRRRRPHQRGRLRQLDPAARRVLEPTRVLQRRHRGYVDARAGGGHHRHGLVRPGRQRARRVRRRDAAQQPPRPATRPAGDQHDPRPRRGRPTAEPVPPPGLCADQRRSARSVHQLVRLRSAPQAPRVADQLRRRLRPPPDHHRGDDVGGQAGCRTSDRRSAAGRRSAGGCRGLHVQHRCLGHRLPAV